MPYRYDAELMLVPNDYMEVEFEGVKVKTSNRHIKYSERSNIMPFESLNFNSTVVKSPYTSMN